MKQGTRLACHAGPMLVLSIAVLFVFCFAMEFYNI